MIVRDRQLKFGEGSIEKRMRKLLQQNFIFISNKNYFKSESKFQILRLWIKRCGAKVNKIIPPHFLLESRMIV